MTKLSLRGLAQRKLRTALTSIAVLLGVAMIVGTYVLVDQITAAFEDITAESVAGVDAVITPVEEFTGSYTEQPGLDEGLVEEIESVPGVQGAAGQVVAFGRLVVDGEVVETMGAPSFVFGHVPEPFAATETVAGRDPARPGEVAVFEGTAEKEGIEIGERIELATRRGLKPVRVVGIVSFGGGGAALGGTSFAVAPAEQVQRWFDQKGEVAAVDAIAEPGLSAEDLAGRIRAVLPAGVRVQTAEENAQEEADEINDQIGRFLTPALLALAGAAVLVGAFIIFNTFSITVAQRMREFAMLRALGATRRQVLAVVAGEALLIGIAASAVGLLAGIGFALTLSELFDLMGFGVPRAGLALAPRTIAVGLAVGIGVTLIAALVPALRAMRVPPVAAMSGTESRPTAAHRRWAALTTALFLLVGLALTAHGLFGSGAATSRLGALGAGAVAFFVGVAMSARYLIRPLASAIGYPVERAFGTAGRLARENAMRNPGRTAVTSAALMVGLALVVFVAVFAAGLKSSFARQFDELVKAEMFIYGQDFVPIPTRSADAVAAVDGVESVVEVLYDQLELGGEESNAAYDVLVGVDPQRLADVYTFEWVAGEDSLLDELDRGEALIEEQFADAHSLEPGDTYRVVTPSGGRARLEAIGVYRDPTILQGSVGTNETLQAISPARDPFALLVSTDDDAEASLVQSDVEEALEAFPTAQVESKAEYQQTIEEQLNQIVYLLYALLAMSVVISLFGIANSLYLSIHERTRELGVLRAIGATAAQLRRVIRYESVITAVIGGLLGTAVGVLFAWLATESLADFGLSVSIPVAQLGVFMALAIVVGMVGAIAPARRGSRIDVLDAIRHE